MFLIFACSLSEWLESGVKQQCAEPPRAYLSTDACGNVTLSMMTSLLWVAECVTDAHQACNGPCGHPDREKSALALSCILLGVCHMVGGRGRKSKCKPTVPGYPGCQISMRQSDTCNNQPAWAGAVRQSVRPVESDAARLDPCVGFSQPSWLPSL